MELPGCVAKDQESTDSLAELLAKAQQLSENSHMTMNSIFERR
jgi:hypothetical protein